MKNVRRNPRKYLKCRHFFLRLKGVNNDWDTGGWDIEGNLYTTSRKFFFFYSYICKWRSGQDMPMVNGSHQCFEGRCKILTVLFTVDHLLFKWRWNNRWKVPIHLQVEGKNLLIFQFFCFYCWINYVVAKYITRGVARTCGCLLFPCWIVKMSKMVIWTILTKLVVDEVAK